MDAALSVFSRHGYESATVRDIAVEARVSAGLLYHYFPSKQAVLQALFERSATLVMQAFHEVATVRRPRARLAALLRTSARLVREHERFWRVSYGVRFQQAVVGGLARGILAQSALFLQLFTALLGEIGRPAPALEARLLFAALDGIFQHYVLDPAGYPLDAVIERLIRQHGGTAKKEPA